DPPAAESPASAPPSLAPLARPRTPGSELLSCFPGPGAAGAVAPPEACALSDTPALVVARASRWPRSGAAPGCGLRPLARQTIPARPQSSLVRPRQSARQSLAAIVPPTPTAAAAVALAGPSAPPALSACGYGSDQQCDSFSSRRFSCSWNGSTRFYGIG